MSFYDLEACAALVRSAAEEIAAIGPSSAENSTLEELISRVKSLSTRAEEQVRSALRERYPDIAWNGEETRAEVSTYWLYDPIDGAYHYLQGLPLWSSSLVLVRDGEPEFALVYDPTLRELFIAERGRGASCNRTPIRASPKTRLSAAVVGTALPPIAQVGGEEQATAFNLARAVSRQVFVLRAMGSASLQLAYVAAGRLDAYCETGQDTADWLAGALLVREAGGSVSDLRGSAFGWSGDGVLAASAHLHASLSRITGEVGALRSDRPD
jgi:myo-inositol-1(or 4)-monophosphatase